MAKPKVEIAKGVKDWFGREAIIRSRTVKILKRNFERYGYNPLETPPIERRETLGFKGGGEIQKEVFRFEDQGDRKLALRFDHTVPLARFCASHPELKLPFKRYAIGQVFRDGPTQPDQGRYRVFTQCDVDVVGISGMSAEAELLGLATDVFQELGLGEVDIKVNNRKLLNGILEHAGVPEKSRTRSIVTLDKMDKIGIEGVEEELRTMNLYGPALRLQDDTFSELCGVFSGDKKISADLRERIVSQVDSEGFEFVERALQEFGDKGEFVDRISAYENNGGIALSGPMVNSVLSLTRSGRGNAETYDLLRKTLKDNEGLREVKQVLDYAEIMGIDSVQFDPALARGLDYYTGTTLEVYLRNKELVKSAILAGGRFDDMIGDFRGKGESIPAVGMSFGLERLVMTLGETMGDARGSVVDVYLVPVGDNVDACLAYSQELRRAGLNVDVWQNGYNKMGKVISHIDSLGVPYVGIVGGDEVANGTMTVKNLERRMQETMPVGNVGEYISSQND
jgi:histidyl-tRNA synthetase